MGVSRKAMVALTAIPLLVLAVCPVACSSSGGSAGNESSGGAGTSQGGSSATAGGTTGGTNATGGAGTSGSGDSGGATGGSAGNPASGGAAGSDSNPSGGASNGGTAGMANAGAAGSAGSGGSSGNASGGAGGNGFEEGDTLPWRPLNVTAMPGEHVHGDAGVDTRAKSLGKLVVDIGVNSGGYVSWLAKRGYHSIGAPCGACAAPNLGGGRDDVGNCRLMEFENTRTSVTQTLTNLASQYPDEDWGYFLNQDGTVRWSDVAITGISHGATTAAVAGHLAERMWRVVSRSGPRDNDCAPGLQCSLPLSTPVYDVNCPDAKIASWIDMPSKTPINRFYALVGTSDGQCGEIMFNMHRAGYVGVPTLFNTLGADLSGTNQFFSTEGGHYDFLRAPDGVTNTEAALNIAFAIPPENQNPNF